MEAVKFAVVAILKLVGLFADRTTSYNSYSALGQTKAISKDQTIGYMDIIFAWIGFSTNFGFYPTLQTLIKPTELEAMAAGNEAFKDALALAKLGPLNDKGQLILTGPDGNAIPDETDVVNEEEEEVDTND